MAYEQLMQTYLGVGLLADRPAAPNVKPGVGAFYYATDTAALYVWDGATWHTLGPPGTAAAAHSSVPITLTTGSEPPLALNVTEYDQGVSSGALQHDPGVAPTRLTCQVAGLYAVSGFVAFASNPTGLRYVAARKNGGPNLLFEDGRAALNGDATEFQLSGQFPFVVGDYIELMAYQNSGQDLGLRLDYGLNPRLAWARVS